MRDLLLGIDVGTTGLKVSFYTVTGELVDGAYREYSLSLPGGGRVEIDPKIWWDRLCDSLSEVFARGKVSAGDVAGIGITCTNSLVLLDHDRQPLMPAVMQLDQRASAQAETLERRFGREWVFARTGNRVASGAFWGPTLQWVRENHPYLYTRARFFLTPTGFLLLSLTGAYCIDHSRASSTMLYNIRREDWDDELCEAFSLSGNLLPTIYKSYEVVGSVSAEGERATGLLEGTPAVAGAMDTIGALAGLGFGSDNGALIMGSVGRLCVETYELDDRFMNTVNVQASGSLSMTPVNSVGLSYKWLKNLLFRDHKAEANAYKAMDEMAEAVRPGSEGLLYMPYLVGERCPLWDPHASGSFMGLKIRHQREHFIRAVLEGVGFALAQNHEILKNKVRVNPVYFLAGGGGANSTVWMQIISDMLGKPLRIPEELETETMGAAMLAGVGIEAFSDISTAQRTWVQVSREVVPDAEAHALYRALLPIFKELYRLNREPLKRWRRLQNPSNNR